MQHGVLLRYNIAWKFYFTSCDCSCPSADCANIEMSVFFVKRHYGKLNVPLTGCVCGFVTSNRIYNSI